MEAITGTQGSIDELQKEMYNLFFSKKQRVVELECLNLEEQINGNLTLIGKLYGGQTIDLEELSEEVHRMWQTEKAKQVRVDGREHVRFTFEEAKERAHVMEQGPWFVHGHILSIKEWAGTQKLEEYNFDYVKF
ncbi:hypothetical protein IFM89_015478 [Coptis chinensis]|uniref:DUF4283 domain-containing protein n=1 Tax=Coptis chinensis TaxID=261450 RepID=A0A835GWC3_9MAGN|nr:hypothetical protein IFM89_015478 [Coptis chinensis]